LRATATRARRQQLAAGHARSARSRQDRSIVRSSTSAGRARVDELATSQGRAPRRRPRCGACGPWMTPRARSVAAPSRSKATRARSGTPISGCGCAPPLVERAVFKGIELFEQAHAGPNGARPPSPASRGPQAPAPASPSDSAQRRRASCASSAGRAAR
jgi:hypothetical protein